MNKYDLIDAICKICVKDKPCYYEGWTVEELQELYINLGGKL